MDLLTSSLLQGTNAICTLLTPLDLPLSLLAFLILLRCCDHLTTWAHQGWARDRIMGAAPYCIAAFVLEICMTMLLRRWTDPVVGNAAGWCGVGEGSRGFVQQWVGTGFTMFHMGAFVEGRRVLGDWGVVVGWREGLEV